MIKRIMIIEKEEDPLIKIGKEEQCSTLNHRNFN